MARGRVGLHGSSGVFARGGQLYTGGPAAGWLQKLHPASRLITGFVLVLGLSLVSHLWVLLAVIVIAIAIALSAYLDLVSIYKVSLVPIAVFALPAWLISALVFETQLYAGSVFFFRTVASVIVVLVILHSVGLRNVTTALRWFCLPRELQLVWSIMIAQVASFSDLISNMSLARDARKICRRNPSDIRKQIGRQSGILYSRTYQRGIDVANALEARTVDDNKQGSSISRTWGVTDHALVLTSTIMLIGASVW